MPLPMIDAAVPGAVAGEWERFTVPCCDCGAPGVVLTADRLLADWRTARCASCGRAHHGAAVPVRPTPGANNHLRMGQGGSTLPAPTVGGMPRVVDAPAVAAETVVLVSSREGAAVPDGAMPAGLPALRDAFSLAGWTWEVCYSRALVPPVLYAASAKDGRAGQVRRAAREVATVTLRVRRPECRAWGAWTDRKWSGGGVLDADGPRRLATLESFRALIGG